MELLGYTIVILEHWGFINYKKDWMLEIYAPSLMFSILLSDIFFEGKDKGVWRVQ